MSEVGKEVTRVMGDYRHQAQVVADGPQPEVEPAINVQPENFVIHTRESTPTRKKSWMRTARLQQSAEQDRSRTLLYEPKKDKVVKRYRRDRT